MGASGSCVREGRPIELVRARARGRPTSPLKTATEMARSPWPTLEMFGLLLRVCSLMCYRICNAIVCYVDPRADLQCSTCGIQLSKFTSSMRTGLRYPQTNYG